MARMQALDVHAEPSMAERAYEAMRARILDLRMLPGQTVPEADLASELGMSRTPVREALARLRMEGLVTAAPRRGFVVTVPTAETMREIYEVVAGLEGQAVRLASLRATDDAIARLDAAIADQEAALAVDDLAGWAEADRRFHRLLREAAGNECMQRLMRQFDGQLHRARVATIRLRPRPHRSTEDHRAIVDAIRAHDPDRALRCVVAHHERANREMLEVVGDYSEFVLRALGRGDDQP